MKVASSNNFLHWLFIFWPVVAFAGDTFQNSYFNQNTQAINYNNTITSTHNHSYGTWANLDNPWDYFPPADSYGRIQMQTMAAVIFRKSLALESNLNRANPDQSRLKQIRQIKMTAAEVYDVLRFGSHRGDLGSALGRLNDQLEALTRETALGSKSSALAEINDLYGQMVRVNGRRLAVIQKTKTSTIPYIKNVDPIGLNTNRIGLSAKKR